MSAAKHLKKLAVSAAFAATALAAQAGEGSFGWLYTLDLQPKGTWEFEQKLQLNRGQHGGHFDLWQARTELEYGVSNDFQLAGYLNSSHVDAHGNYEDGSTGGWLVPGSAGTDRYKKSRIDGVSLEGIWRVTNPVVDPIGLGFYLEGTTGKVKDEVEGRVLLQKNYLDDKLVLAANLHVAVEKVKFDPEEEGHESMADLLMGATYRFANNWTAGWEWRHHNDFEGYRFNHRTQRADFMGPNVHYATKDWWVTAAWRYQIGGTCWAPGDAECSASKKMVWDSHSRNEYIVKVGFPF
jgi:hypothetical protein